MTLLYPTLCRMSSPSNRQAAPRPAVLWAALAGMLGGAPEGRRRGNTVTMIATRSAQGSRRGIVNLLSGLSSSRLVGDTCGMSPLSTNRYKNHRFPAEIISHGVWLYFRFCLSYRDVEELLFARGVMVTYEAIRKWCRKFGQEYANHLRRRRPRPGDKWHLDEVFLTINGTRHDLWGAVDQDGHVLDIPHSTGFSGGACEAFTESLLR